MALTHRAAGKEPSAPGRPTVSATLRQAVEWIVGDSKVVTNCAVRSEGGRVNDDLLGVHARLGIGSSSPSEKDD